MDESYFGARRVRGKKGRGGETYEVDPLLAIIAFYRPHAGETYKIYP